MEIKENKVYTFIFKVMAANEKGIVGSDYSFNITEESEDSAIKKLKSDLQRVIQEIDEKVKNKK